MKFPHWRAVAAAAITSPLLALGMMAAPAAHAATFPPEPTSFAQGNLFSLNHYDFENASDLGAVSVSNATVSQGTGTTMLHNSSLKVTTTAAGNTVWKQADSHSMAVKPGASYRVGEYFHSPAVAGDTVTYALGGYSSSGVWQGWTSGSAKTLANTPNWQYVTSVITIPSTVSQVVGVRVTETGTQAGDITRVDEATFSSDRAAVAIGAVGDHCGDGSCGNYTATDFLHANATSPSPGAIGPLQTTKEFYGSGNGLPVFSNSVCSGIEAGISDHTKWPVCIIAYKDQVSQATMTAFMQSVPADQQVVLVYHQEPEGDYASGSTFVSEFTSQYAEYRAAGNFENITMVDNAASYPYKNGAIGCTYIVPPASTDGYAIDFYEATVDGKNVSQNVDRGTAWVNWANCVKGQGKPLGIFEQGYKQDTTSNVNNTIPAMQADDTYLRAAPDTLGQAFLYRDYWDTDYGGSSVGPPDNMLTTSAEVAQWQANETENGGY